MRSPEHLDEVLLVLGELGTINIRRAYGNWAKASLKGWGLLTGQQSIVPVQQFDVVKGKSVTDMRMVIDAMDLHFRGQRGRLRDHVVGQRFPAACDQRSARRDCRSTGSARPRPRFPSSSRAPASSTSARWRWARRMSSSSRKVGKGQRPVDTELLQVLGAAYKASKRDEDGYTPLSELGQRAKAVSSFAARNYGFTRLSDLIKAVPNFEVKPGTDGALLVKRLR